MSAQLWQLIANNDLQDQPASEIHAALTEKSVEVRTTFFLTFNQVNLLFPAEIAQAFAAKVGELASTSPWWEMLRQTLCGVGVDLSLDKTQQMLDALAGEFGAELVGTLKALGLRQISKLEQAGIADEPTVEQITAIVSTRAAIMSLRDRSNAIKERVDALFSAWEQGQSVDVPVWEEIL